MARLKPQIERCIVNAVSFERIENGHSTRGGMKITLQVTIPPGGDFHIVRDLAKSESTLSDFLGRQVSIALNYAGEL